MTDEGTTESWRNSLRERLDQALPTHTATSRERIAWLALHLREYVERWVGFVEHPSVANEPEGFTVGSGMYQVIAVATELIEAEWTNDVPVMAKVNWPNFVQLYTTIQDTGDLAPRRQLLLLATDLATSLQRSD